MHVCDHRKKKNFKHTPHKIERIDKTKAIYTTISDRAPKLQVKRSISIKDHFEINMENAISDPSIAAIEHSHANIEYGGSNETSDIIADGGASEPSGRRVDGGEPPVRRTGAIVTDATASRVEVAVAMANALHDATAKQHAKRSAFFLHPPGDEMSCADIAATTEDIKRLKHVQVRSNSTGKLYQSSRRVSFPENDSELVTGYLEPADPWACG